MNTCVPSALLFLLFYHYQGAWVKEIDGTIVKLSLYGSSTSINIPASWLHGENESGLPLMPWLSTCAIVEVVLSVDTQALIFWASLQHVLLPRALCSAPCSQTPGVQHLAEEIRGQIWADYDREYLGCSPALSLAPGWHGSAALPSSPCSWVGPCDWVLSSGMWKG